jgi:hypothetical protein
LNFISDIQNSDGKTPSHENQLKEADIATHWCHGSPGAIPLFIEGSKLFKEKQLAYLSAAQNCG